MSNAYPAYVSEFQKCIGEKHVLLSQRDKAPYLVEWRDKFDGESECVLRPGNTQEVSALVKIATSYGLKLIPQSGNTGLVGGQIPRPGKNEIVVSLARLNKIRQVDAEGYSITVDGGVTLQTLQEAAEKAGRLFPLSLASQGSCQIAGNIASNAGGTAVLSYGNARDLVLGLEVVLANGEIWHGLRTLRKDNTGYDLKHLFIGSEGTLGIITGASLKLFPKPVSQIVAFCALDSAADLLQLFSLAKQHAGSMLTGFEILPKVGMQFAVTHQEGARLPFQHEHNWYVLLELSATSAAIELNSLGEMILAQALESSFIEDAVLAQNQSQAEAFWRLRHGMSEVQKFEGGSIKHDVSVPVAHIPVFLEETIEAVSALIPGCRPVPFGHMGDGNIHFNISQPIGADKQAYLERWDEVNEVVHGIVAKYDGSISAEHGIGILKRDLLGRVKSKTELDMMKSIKRTLDPSNMFSPERIITLDD
ncbi:FAD-binding oxidoreductase [Polycladidibacter stylochi]|uniref:FAD-binding oxidoreductase n=1 Tax=Polycladidibacter stylochi TaxID=1807766 RepID=UPI00082D8F62|nr:FAD-binding oxidoreductase [Pseudovibrio stylochi]